MRALVLLIFAVAWLSSAEALANMTCVRVFSQDLKSPEVSREDVLERVRTATEPVTAPVHPVFPQMRELTAQIEALKVFGGSKGSRRKAKAEIEADLAHVERDFAKILQKSPNVREYADLWMNFNSYWLNQINSFHTLPVAKQQALRADLEIPLSISLKHFIAFLEAPNHIRWKMGRLKSILNIHEKHANVDVEAALFLLRRQIEKFYSRWDFINCLF